MSNLPILPPSHEKSQLIAEIAGRGLWTLLRIGGHNRSLLNLTKPNLALPNLALHARPARPRGAIRTIVHLPLLQLTDQNNGAISHYQHISIEWAGPPSTAIQTTMREDVSESPVFILRTCARGDDLSEDQAFGRW